MRCILFFSCVVSLGLGCDEPPVRPGPDAPTGDAGATTDAGPIGARDAGAALDRDAGTADDAGTAGAPPPPPSPAMACAYRSDDFGGAMQQLDSGPSGGRLMYVLRGLPDPSLVDRATLTFRSYDADHPGQEGAVWINGLGPYDLPADTAWDNGEGTGAIDVLSALVPGDNLVEFGPGPLSRSYFRIGDVAIDADARVSVCMPPPPPPDPSAVERTIHYRDATYSNRRTWVIRCDDYAFTASGDEHTATDCDGGYAPGGNRRGTATFRFERVVRADYEVIIRSRHTENRNPAGALFIVDGVERRISQRSDRNHTDDLWGVARLEGTVDVVLDSSREGNSDSVISVRLVPVTP